MGTFPMLWYEKEVVDTLEVSQMRDLLERAGISFLDMHPATEVGPTPYLEANQFIFPGVSGVLTFIRRNNKGLEDL